MRIFLAIFVLLAIGCSKGPHVAVWPTTARVTPSDSAAVAQEIPLGRQMILESRPFDEKGWLRLGSSAWVKAEHVRKMPLETEEMFVAVPETFLMLKPGGAVADRGRKVELGDRIAVVKGFKEGEARIVVEKDGVRGIVLAKELGNKKPSADDAAKFAIAALSEPELDLALARAEKALGFDDKHVVAREIAAAILNDRDWNRAVKLRKGLPDKTPLPRPAPVSEAEAGKDAFVSASLLRLRATPKQDGKKVAELPIGTRVNVEDIKGDWATVKVVSEGEVFIDMTKDPVVVEATGLADGDGERGFVPAAYLDAKLLSADDLSRRAEEAKSIDEKLVWRQRAAKRQPSLTNTRAYLEAAIAAQRFDLAVDAAKAVRASYPDAADLPDVAIDLEGFIGCKGDLKSADVECNNEDIPDLCPLEGEPTRDDAVTSLYGLGEEPPADEENQERKINDHLQELKSGWADMKREHDAGMADAEKRRAEIEEKYPSGPLARVAVDWMAPTPAHKLFVYTYAAKHHTSACDYSPIQLNATLEEVPLPSSAVGSATIWVKLDGTWGAGYGVAVATSETKASNCVNRQRADDGQAPQCEGVIVYEGALGALTCEEPCGC